MPLNRYFLDAPFQADAEVLLTGEEAHHLSRVMRKKEGDAVELVNGQNALATAALIGSEKKGVRLRLLSIVEQEPPARALIICQALPRFNRLETIAEKGTELGMTALWLFPGELSEKKELSPTQLTRLKGITVAAMKQSGRLDLPSIHLHPPLKQWKPRTSPAYFGDLNPEAPPFLSALSKSMQDDILFFVGPEAGLTSAEEQQLLRLQATGVRLHTNILRTDTASLTALSVISNFFLTKN
ncbi:RsmE family RNA methyltransferase [Chlamydiota bacterium]